MRMFFVHTVEVESARWCSAFPDALKLSLAEAESYPFTSADTVWLVLRGDYSRLLTRVEQAGARLVALSLDESAAEARRLMSAGARGYVHALAAPELLQQVYEVVANGGLWLGRSLMSTLLSPINPPGDSYRLHALTARERAVALAVASGKNNKEIARELDITERTVKAHLSACFEKLNVRDRVQLALALKA